MKMLKKLSASLALVAVSSVSLAAPLAAIDTADIVTSFTNQVTPITAVLVATLGLAVLFGAYKWIRKAAH